MYMYMQGSHLKICSKGGGGGGGHKQRIGWQGVTCTLYLVL